MDERGSEQVFGCTLEKHKYAHIETCLCGEMESGVFIMGKLSEENVLVLTAFVIARGQTLYIPAGTIHTNDYQRGLWRSYSEIDEDTVIGTLVKKSNNDEYINLKFYDNVTKRRLCKYENEMNDGCDDNEHSASHCSFCEHGDYYTHMPINSKFLSTEL